MIYRILPLAATVAAFTLAACGGGKQTSQPVADTVALNPAPAFCADSAMSHINMQCDFGARTPGSAAHKACGDWIAAKFSSMGLAVSEQKTEVTAWDGKTLPVRNITASTNPDSKDRVLLCAHWDSRPWADNDPDPEKHNEPVLAANDGASGVAVMLEIARLAMQQPLDYGIDFVCFDVEDYGTHNTNDSWCLGSTYWATQARDNGYQARYGVLFDMVGGRGSHFAMEGYSLHYCRPVTSMLWQLARQLGYSSIFMPGEGGFYATDDHVPVNQIAGIPCLDIIPHCSDGPSSFGPTWHTTSDTPANIDPNILKAVGQSVVQLLWND